MKRALYLLMPPARKDNEGFQDNEIACEASRSCTNHRGAICRRSSYERVPVSLCCLSVELQEQHAAILSHAANGYTLDPHS